MISTKELDKQTIDVNGKRMAYREGIVRSAGGESMVLQKTGDNRCLAAGMTVQ